MENDRELTPDELRFLEECRHTKAISNLTPHQRNVLLGLIIALETNADRCAVQRIAYKLWKSLNPAGERQVFLQSFKSLWD